MNIHDIINYKDPFTTMKRDDTFDFNNDYGASNPAWSNNPQGWGSPDHNPKGAVPVLNPEHYIHPLTGRYAADPLDFS